MHALLWTITDNLQIYLTNSRGHYTGERNDDTLHLCIFEKCICDKIRLGVVHTIIYSILSHEEWTSDLPEI